MAVDIEAVRFAYFNPPPDDVFDGVPTIEEQLAEAERRLVRLCIEDGGDPVAEALGEHGSLIGGPDKPLRLLIDHARPLEEYARPRLAPPAWFDHPQGKATSGLHDPEHMHLRMAIASHMAGTPHKSRPTPEQLLESLTEGLGRARGEMHARQGAAAGRHHEALNPRPARAASVT